MLGAISLILFVCGIKLPSLALRILSTLPLVITLLFAAFDRRLWHMPGILRLVRRPWMSGTWVGDLTSYRTDPDSGTPITSKHAVVFRVEQTFTSISAVLMTAESKSRSLAAEFISHGAGDYTLLYTYDNTPKLEYRDRSKIHRGGTAVELHGPSPDRLEAEYWTNRDTKGTFSLRLVSRKLVGTFEEGNQLDVPSERRA
jgi:SMODS-associating 2TM, beta-strand rich effector domain